MRPRLLAAMLVLACGARTGLDTSASLPEACNGIDDDGDGRVDEDVPPLVCGIGVCRNETDGCPMDLPPRCDPRPPGDEACNGLDDDCDGATDEDLGFGLIAGPFEVADEATGYFVTDLVAVGGGMVAVWNTGFDGSHPPPTNAFSRQLDADGHPIGERIPILERVVTTGLTAEPSPRGIVLTYCGRFGFTDLAASAFLDANGAPLGGEVRRGDGTRSCGAVSQSGIYSGMRHLFAWITNGDSGDGTFPIFLDVAGDDGISLAGSVVEQHGDLYSRPWLAVHGDRVALAYGVRPTLRSSALDLRMLALDGTPLETVRVAMETEEHAYGHAAVVPTPEGFLVIASDPNGPGLYSGRTSASGDLLAPLELVETSGRRFDAIDAIGSVDGAAYVVADAWNGAESTVYVARLDAAGRPSAVWEEASFVISPSLALEGSRLFLLSVADDDRRLEIRELGCSR